MKIENITTQLSNIIELAAQLVIEGKATTEKAMELALKQDNENTLKCVEDMEDMRRGYINEKNKTQKAFGIIMESVYSKLS